MDGQYLYHWCAMKGDSNGNQICDGTISRNYPIATSDDYDEVKKDLVQHLNANGKRFNITSLTLLTSPPARKSDG